MLGAGWLLVKTEGALFERAARWGRAAVLPMGLALLAVSVATPLVSTTIRDKWFTLPNFIGLMPIPLATTVAFVTVLVVLQRSFADSSPASDDAYMDGPIKVATVAAVLWGVAGFAIGDFIAWQMAFPALNLDLPWTSFGRMRPLHTSAVIFAFGGNALIATSFYVVQRTSRARLPPAAN